MLHELADVWVFCGAGARFPSGVFRARSSAEDWIGRYRLSGTLTKYPLDEGVYDWAVRGGFFEPKRAEHSSATFVQGFSSASQEHYHYSDGVLD
ncbi:DUF7710 domain-containing protein [Pyxidicoccus sp. MSG2]|uniref:DUF7710 domain-containing protein n=1 Tax=Pyxidicoccus sp. MSG2 TaxID=2996790 RepID=UPI003B641EF7